MRLIKPSYEILTSVDRFEMLRTIETTGRTCYKSEEKITEDSASRFVRGIVARGHESVIEHVSISVRFVVDRGVSHELVRHRLMSFSQESTRYCDYSDGHVTFVIPPWIGLEPMEVLNEAFDSIWDGNVGRWISAMRSAEIAYHDLRRGSWTPQRARSVLPNSLKTEIVCTANLREWRHVLRLRTSGTAHPQMREVMIPLSKELSEKLPEVFENISICEQ